MTGKGYLDYKAENYDPIIAHEICCHVSLSDCSLYDLRAANPHWPQVPEIYFWRLVNQEFDKNFDDAKKRQAQLIFENILSIADDSQNDLLQGEFYRNGRPKIDHENIQRSKLKIETRWKYLAKLLPKVYGDKLELTSGDGKEVRLAELRNKIQTDMYNRG